MSRFRQKGGFSVKHSRKFQVATPTFGHVKVRTEYRGATLGLVKRLEISKELMRECVTLPGCCWCMPLLHNHLMDSCSYVRKNTLLITCLLGAAVIWKAQVLDSKCV